jgi:hypothetical protein
MSHKAGDVIKEWGKYRIQHYQQHVKDSYKNFKPETIMSKPVSFLGCSRCPLGYQITGLMKRVVGANRIVLGLMRGGYCGAMGLP